MKKTVGTEELARIFSVTRKSVQIWIAEGMPVARQGKQGGESHRLDVRDCFEWWMKRNYERLAMLRTQTELCSQRADGIAMENAGKRAELVPLVDIEREYGRLLEFIRTEAWKLPEQLAPACEGLTVFERKAVFERAIFDLLDRAANFDPPAAADGMG
jgi:phage terminase Nu1 subunit (DNA packaging protein)